MLHVLLVELTENVEHAFRVTASTVMGEGQPSLVTTATPKRLGQRPPFCV